VNYKTIMLCAIVAGMMQSAWGMEDDKDVVVQVYSDQDRAEICTCVHAITSKVDGISSKLEDVMHSIGVLKRQSNNRSKACNVIQNSTEKK